MNDLRDYAVSKNFSEDYMKIIYLSIINDENYYKEINADELLRNSDITIPLWLKSKMFESVINSYGLNKYIEELLNYDGNRPEKDVDINSFLASIKILTSLSQFTMIILDQLKKENKIILNDEQYMELKKIFNPSKNFVIDFSDVNFNSFKLEDIKKEIMNYSLDLLSSIKYEKDVSVKTINLLRYEKMDKIPNDLKFIKKTSIISFDKLINLTLKYRTLKIVLINGYLAYKYGTAPTIFIKNRDLYYSPSESQFHKKTTKKSVLKQVELIEKALKIKENDLLCEICKQNKTLILAWEKDKGIIPVCNDCITAPSIVGYLGKLNPIT